MVDFFRNCIRFALVFVISICLMLALDYFVLIKDYKPSYESHTSILVGENLHLENSLQEEQLNSEAIFKSLQIGEKMVYDLPEIVYGTKVLENVNDALKANGFSEYPLDGKDFKKSVKTDIVKNSRVLNITVKSANPKQSQLIASTIVKSLDDAVKEIVVKDYIHILKNADATDAKVGTSIKTLWLLGVIGGVALGFFIVLIYTIIQEGYYMGDFNE